VTETTSGVRSSSTDDRYVVQYDRLSDEPLSVAIADAVATYHDQEVTTLEPLHYAINADALERLFEPRPDGVRTGGSVAFEYSDCLVTVTAAGEIAIDST
jgi:hypothetical protein